MTALDFETSVTEARVEFQKIIEFIDESASELDDPLCDLRVLCG
ncbi:MAG: hypothetical protein NUW37_19195 [Planctomycetes bacterium]|nr:hypothetical protein [Planctomycetota bacterium]